MSIMFWLGWLVRTWRQSTQVLVWPAFLRATTVCPHLTGAFLGNSELKQRTSSMLWFLLKGFQHTASQLWAATANLKQEQSKSLKKVSLKKQNKTRNRRDVCFKPTCVVSEKLPGVFRYQQESPSGAAPPHPPQHFLALWTGPGYIPLLYPYPINFQ